MIQVAESASHPGAIPATIQEEKPVGRNLARTLRLGAFALVFSAGYWLGAAQQLAQAQVGDLMKKASEAGGPLGTAAKMGTMLTEMQEQVDGLQKNLGALNEIKAALGGGS
jgi:hypothetical protein